MCALYLEIVIVRKTRFCNMQPFDVGIECFNASYTCCHPCIIFMFIFIIFYIFSCGVIIYSIC